MAWTEEKIEQMLGNLLRTGVIAAGIIVLTGGIIYLARYGAQLPDYKIFRGEPEYLKTVSGIVRAALSGSRRGLIQLGLLALIATPVARVAFSIFAFIRQKDYFYIAVTAGVLSILIYSLVWGRA
ncbi:MAG TPA: DUF1634 domain-containing protein [Candidatus Omnitrophota bacterium]|nr:DUF1634 domain-containing protein [Candidatus Omnitrophota bacterium]